MVQAIVLSLLVANKCFNADLNNSARSKYNLVASHIVGGNNPSLSFMIAEDYPVSLSVNAIESGFGLVFRKVHNLGTEAEGEWTERDECLFVGARIKEGPFSNDRLAAYTFRCSKSTSLKSVPAEEYTKMVTESSKWSWLKEHSHKNMDGMALQGQHAEGDFDNVYRRHARLTLTPNSYDKEALVRHREEKAAAADAEAASATSAAAAAADAARRETENRKAMEKKATDEEWFNKNYRYELNANWLRVREQNMWNDSRVNVAVMGSNNMGKSAFLNSIMGVDAEEEFDGTAFEDFLHRAKRSVMNSLWVSDQMVKPFAVGVARMTKWEMVWSGESSRDCDYLAQGLTFWDLPGMEGETVDQYARMGGLRFFDAVVIAVENELLNSDINLIAHLFKSNHKAKLFFVKTKMNIFLKGKWNEIPFPACLNACPDFNAEQKAARNRIVGGFDEGILELKKEDEGRRWVNINADNQLQLSSFIFSGFSKWFDGDPKKGRFMPWSCKQKAGRFFREQHQQFRRMMIEVASEAKHKSADTQTPHDITSLEEKRALSRIFEGFEARDLFEEEREKETARSVLSFRLSTKRAAQLQVMKSDSGHAQVILAQPPVHSGDLVLAVDDRFFTTSPDKYKKACETASSNEVTLTVARLVQDMQDDDVRVRSAMAIKFEQLANWMQLTVAEFNVGYVVIVFTFCIVFCTTFCAYYLRSTNREDGKVFAHTVFKKRYVKNKAARTQDEFYRAARRVIHWHASRHNISAADADQMYARLREHAQLAGSTTEAVRFVAVRVWTSAERLGGVFPEFCSMLNEALREDDAAVMEAIVIVVATHNLFIVTGRGPEANPVRWPKDLKTYRGGGIAAWARAFFVVGLEFRTRMVVATSDDLTIAQNFLRQASEEPILWTYVFDSKLKCDHVNFVDRTDGTVSGESEYDFAPYSVFTVLSISWSSTPWSTPHKIELKVAPDNRSHSDYLPLAPYS